MTPQDSFRPGGQARSNRPSLTPETKRGSYEVAARRVVRADLAVTACVPWCRCYAESGGMGERSPERSVALPEGAHRHGAHAVSERKRLRARVEDDSHREVVAEPVREMPQALEVVGPHRRRRLHLYADHAPLPI